jgi:hypothetical protein
LGLNFDTLGVIIPLNNSGTLAFDHIGEMNVAEGEVAKTKYVLVATGTEKDAKYNEQCSDNCDYTLFLIHSYSPYNS